ncbi:MAG TPA: molybdopterin oxidoreductase family protein [Dehalococcoidia bacterium]|nr:molybdopterin oxidoreductase family protein [Dehalococcoidia bacterium]
MTDRLIRAACPHDCPDTCALIVTVRDGRAVALAGDPEHPFTRGFLCAKVAHFLDRVYDPDRLLHPWRRVGPKGSGKFERITWDAALDEIAARFRAIANSPEGPQAILPYSYLGTQGILQSRSLDRRFFHRLGASLLDRNICATAGLEGYAYTVGRKLTGIDPEAFAASRLILVWGTNLLTTNVHQWPFLREARRRGARIVVIDPYRGRTAAIADDHLPIRPGTDAALALGLMHVIVAEGLVDRDYVDRHTIGFEPLRARVAEYPPERVADITGLAPDRIRALAIDYATIRPAAIRLNAGLQRHSGGGMAVRTIACLPALVGAWRDRGGGMLLVTGGAFPLNRRRLERPDLCPPGTRLINMSQLGRVLTNSDGLTAPPIRALYVYNSNPAAIAPEQRLVLEGLRRADLFTVVHDLKWTDTTDYADIVLPATTQLEQADLVDSWGHHYLTWNEPAVAPLGEAKPNSEVFRLLAQRLGFGDEPAFTQTDDEILEEGLRWGGPELAGITLQTVKERGWVRLTLPNADTPLAQGGFTTPSGKCEFYSETLAREGFDPLPVYHPPAEVADANLARRYPIALLSPKAHHFFNSSYSGLPRFARAERGPAIELHPADAADRGLRDGDLVRVHNDRGEFRARLRVSDRVRPGVAVAPSIWWNRSGGGGGNVNQTTPAGPTDFGGAPSFYDNRVEVSAGPGTSDGWDEGR